MPERGAPAQRRHLVARGIYGRCRYAVRMMSGPVRASCATLLLVLGGSGCGKPADPRPTGGAAQVVNPTPEHQAAQAAEAKRIGAPATFVNAHGHEFALVPTCEFEMGTGAHRHMVRLSTSFYIQTGWVTMAQRRAWRADAPDGSWTHDDAQAYAAWLTEHDGYFRYRLPSEAEWACAAQAHVGIGGIDSRPTWCSDWFAPLPDYLVGDPIGPTVGEERVVRGEGPRRGAPPDAARAAVRLVAEVGYGNETLGVVDTTFRTVERSSKQPVPKPGYALRMISIRDRLLDRQLGRPLRWRELGRAPWRMLVVPGRYYVHSYEVKDGQEIWGREQKVDIPGAPSVVDIELPNPAVLKHQ